MKITIFFLLMGISCLYGNLYAQDERTINELLDVLSQNHMGKITDVFTIEELGRIKDYYEETSLFKQEINVLEEIRLSTTQSVSQVQAADINPSNLSSIDILANSPNTDFEGAGLVLRGQQSNSSIAYIILNDSQVLQQRNLLTGAYTVLGPVTGLPAGFSVTGLTVSPLISTNLIAIATNGMGGSATYSIGIESRMASLISTNNLVLPIALAEDGKGAAVTLDIDDDNAYRVDLSTGAVSLMGPAGIDINFGQGMTYDPAQDKIYCTPYNASLGDSALYEMNPSSGQLILKGVIQPGTVQQFGWCSSYDRDELSVPDITIDGLVIYPNPVDDTIYVEANTILDSFDIYTLLGQRLHSETNATRLRRLDISFLTSGMYVLKINSADLSATYKFVKR